MKTLAKILIFLVLNIASVIMLPYYIAKHVVLSVFACGEEWMQARKELKEYMSPNSK